MNVYLDTAHITTSHGGLRFLVLSEIEPQLVKAPLAATISSYLISLIHQTRPCMKCRIEHHHREVHALRNVPFKLLSGNAKLKWFEKGKFLWSHWRMGTFGLAAVTLLPEKKRKQNARMG